MSIRSSHHWLIRLVVRLFVPKSEREFFLGDLDEMFAANRRGHDGRRSWFREALGAVQLIIETRRHTSRSTLQRGDSILFGFARDIRFGLRMMTRSPGFTTVAVLTLALGIGANTAIFSVVDAVLLEPLPFLEPGRLMRPSLVIPAGPNGPTAPQDVVWSVPKFEAFKNNQRVFSASAMYKGRTYTLTGDGEPERIRGEVVESAYLGVLGVAPMLGRDFNPEDDVPGASPVVLLTHRQWLRRWGGDPTVLGRTVMIAGTPFAVVGVLPDGFRGLSGTADVFLPFSIIDEVDRTGPWNHSYLAVARLKSGITATQARADMEALGRRIDEAYPPSHHSSPQGWGATAKALNELRADPALRTSILLLLGAVGFVLLITCVNLANLLLARTAERRREVAIRVAIGSGRARIVQQFLVENLVLATGGVTLGLGLAFLCVAGIRSLGPASRCVLQGDYSSLTVLGLDRIEVDGTVLLFTLAVAVVTCLLFGLAPALKASRPDLTRELKEGSAWRAGKKSVGYLSGRGLLVVTEFALAFVLLAGSGLMLKSLARLHSVDMGFVSEGILTASLTLPAADYGESERELFFFELLERVRAIPGVLSAGMNDYSPVSGVGNSTNVRFFDRPDVARGSGPPVDILAAGPGFFETMGVPLIRGRVFETSDGYGDPKVALLSESAANEFWPGEDPIGKKIGLGHGEGFWDGAEVVGIVGDVHFESIETLPDPTAYIPRSQVGRFFGSLFVRVLGDPTAVAGPVRQAVRAMDPNIPLTGVRTMDQRVAAATVRTRFSASLLSLFAAVALLLSMVGIFGVLSYLVTQQTREIGIRMALGAQRVSVFGQILRRSLALTALGVVFGALASLGLTRFLGSLLFDVRPNDPTTLVLVAVLLSTVSVVAAYLPAQRATRVQPLEALREG